MAENKDINTELLNKVLELAENTVHAQTITTDRLIKDEKEISDIRAILLGDGTNLGLVSRVRANEVDIKELKNLETDKDIKEIKSKQDKIEAQNKVLLSVGISILIGLIANILKVVFI